MSFLADRTRTRVRVVRERMLRGGQGRAGDQPGPGGRRRRGRIVLWALSLGASGALLVVVIRIVLAALLVTPAASGAVVSRVPLSPGSGEGPAGQTSHSGATSAATPAPVSCGAAVCPVGVPGSWSLSFDDEFDGTSLDASKWSTMDGQKANDVTALASNLAVTGGCLVLTLSDPKHGAEVSSSPANGAGSGGYLLPVGSYAEARVLFPGNGTTIYNWPAWWTSSGPAWPAGGELDITEGMDTLWTVYHGADKAHYGASIPGVWSNEFHRYGVYRATDHADVYWDGKKIASYPTSDNGAGHGLLVTLGNGPWGGVVTTGAASQVKVDYVRAWRPTS